MDSTEKLLNIIRGQAKDAPAQADPSPGTGGASARLSLGAVLARFGQGPAAPAPGKGQVVLGVEIRPGCLRLVKTPAAAAAAGRAPSGGAVVALPAPAPGGEALTPAVLGQAIRAFLGPDQALEIWTTLPFSQAEIFSLRIPQVPPKQLFSTVYWAVKKEKAFEDQEFILDFILQGQAVENGVTKHEVTACLVPRADVRRLADLFASAGFKLKGLTPPSFAVQALLGSGLVACEDAPLALLDVDEASSRIDLFVGRRLTLSRGVMTGMVNMAEVLLEVWNKKVARGGFSLSGRGGGGDPSRTRPPEAPGREPSPEQAPSPGRGQAGPVPAGALGQAMDPEKPVRSPAAPERAREAAAGLRPAILAAEPLVEPLVEAVAESMPEVEFAVPDLSVPAEVRSEAVRAALLSGPVAEAMPEISFDPGPLTPAASPGPQVRPEPDSPAGPPLAPEAPILAEPGPAGEGGDVQGLVLVEPVLEPVLAEPVLDIGTGSAKPVITVLADPDPGEGTGQALVEAPPEVEALPATGAGTGLGLLVEAETEPLPVLEFGPGTGGDEAPTDPDPAGPDQALPPEYAGLDLPVLEFGPGDMEAGPEPPEASGIAPEGPEPLDEFSFEPLDGEEGEAPADAASPGPGSGAGDPARPAQPLAPASRLADKAEARALLDAVFLDPDDGAAPDRPGPDGVLDLVLPVALRLAKQVQRTLEYHTTALGHPEVKAVLVSGGVVGTPHFAAYFQRELSIPARVLEIGPPAGAAPDAFPRADRDRRALVLAAGLSVCGAAGVPNLLAPFQTRDRAAKTMQVGRLATLGMAAAILVVLGVFVWLRVAVGERERTLKGLQAQLAQFVPRVDQNLLTQTAVALAAKQTAVRGIVQRYEAMGVLADLAASPPPEVRLLSLALVLDTPADREAARPPTPAGAPAAGKAAPPPPPAPAKKDPRKPEKLPPELTLEGVVKADPKSQGVHLTSYLARLQGSPYLSGPRILSQNEDTIPGLGQVLRFVVKAHIK